MFKFTLSDSFRQRGVSPDAISPEMRNRFDACFNENGTSVLDRRIQVRLDETVIRFFFYKDNIDADVLIEEKYQEIASISLNNVKETGDDILYFMEKIEQKCPKEVKDCENSVIEITKNLVGYPKVENEELRLFNFPFIDSWSFNVNESAEKWFTFFMQCCFLYFLFEFENRESDFQNSPIYDKVRDKLCQSDVYQLLYAKIGYTIRLYEGTAPLSDEDYNNIAQKYADRLMDKNQNKVVPHDYYKEQLWFYNPEIELDFIVKTNDKNSVAKLSDKLYGKIRNYFFTRHAIVSAMGNKGAKTVYWFYLGLIGAFSIYATMCLLCFDNKTFNCFFDYVVLWDWIAVVTLVLLVGLWCSTRSLSVFMPRVLVAIGIGWLTTFISEDLIKSQVSINKQLTIAAWLGAFSLISLLILGKIRKYSPYYFSSIRQYHDKLLIKQLKNEKDGWKATLTRLVMWIPAFFCFVFDFKRAKHPSYWKLLPILIHSYFWALTLGVIMQLALYKDLLEHSKVLPEVVFEQTYEKADNYVMYLNNLKDVLVSYEDDWLALCSGSTRSIGTSKNSDKLSFIKMYPDPDFNKYQERFRSKANDVNAKFERVEDFKDSLYDSLDSLRKNRCCHTNKDASMACLSYQKTSISDSLLYFLDNMVLNSDSSSVKKYNIIVDQLMFLDSIITMTEEEVRKTLIFNSENMNWNSLIVWSDWESNWEIEPDNIQDCLKLSAICDKNLCRNVKDLLWFSKKEDKKLYLFPRMLVFHTLIVLILAIVGQLIVSDKSVTEPL